jgi:glycosyltransferase involved in cell wall biosynthesis
MRICLVQYEGLYPYSIGGPGVVAHNLLKQFDKNGAEVELLLFWDRPPPSHSDLGLSPNIRIHTIRYHRWNFGEGLSKCFTVPGSVIHFNNIGAWPPHTLFPILCRLARRPVILSMHGYTPLELKLNRRHRWPWSWLLDAELRLLLPRVDRVIVFSEYMKELLCRHVARQKIKLLPLGVDLQSYGAARREMVKSDGQVRMVFVGRLATVKGLEFLIKAIGLMRSTFQFHTYIIGVGGIQSRLEALVKDLRLEDKVELCGYLSEEKKLACLKNSDIFVLPSLYEPIPLAILEALAAGLPVIASDVGGIPELVRDGYNGLLVKPGNPPELAAALSKLVDDRELRDRLASNAKPSVGGYDWSCAAKRYLEFYEELSETKN